MAPQWASDALVEAVGSAAAELGAGIHLHSLESRLQRAWGDAFAGGRELERLADAGVLGDRSALAHGVWLRDPTSSSSRAAAPPSSTTPRRTCASPRA